MGGEANGTGTRRSDLDVRPISDALSGWRLDVAVSGSIGAVESVRFIRALRRLGAHVTPWLTHGGSRFVTKTSLEWAAGCQAITDFSGNASHIGQSDGLVMAPASASLLGKLAQGIADSPVAALATSYLGQGRPILAVANMHDSLAESPAVARNLHTLERDGVWFAPSRAEEGKQKFPDPTVLADEVAHRLNGTPGGEAPRVLVTLGTTRGYMDAVRYVSNYSSGRLGSLVGEELYRRGLETDVVCGPADYWPRVSSSLRPVKTNTDMEEACRHAIGDGAKAAVLAASVLDYVPAETQPGKIRSGQDELSVSFRKTRKIIEQVKPPWGVKVGFKLETDLTEDRAREWANSYMRNYSLSQMVLNDLADVDGVRHKAFVFEESSAEPTVVESKAALAATIADHVDRRVRAKQAAERSQSSGGANANQ